MALDLQVVRAATELNQRPRDDVDEAPSKLAKSRRVAFTAQLAGDPGSDFRNAPEAADGVVACGDLRPAQVEDIELVLAASAPRLDVHALEQVGVALGVEDDDHFPARSMDVLGDIHLGQASLAHPCGAQHQGMSNALAERQTGFLLLRFDAVQQWRAAHRR
ncbi:hypothetical protein D3C79_777920 [compost metagenome]